MRTTGQARALKGLVGLGAAAVIALAGCGSGGGGGPIPVVLATDAGVEIDDQWTLTYLLLLEEAGVIDLRSVVTTHAPNLGSQPSQRSAAVVRDVIARFGPADPPPVVAGAGGPLGTAAGDDQAGALHLLAEAAGFSPGSRLVIVLIGAATDVANAVLLDPQFHGRIDVRAMGFESWPGGGDPFNVRNDPGAWEVVLASGAPLTIGFMDTSIAHLSLDEAKAAEVTRDGGAMGEFLRSIHADQIRRFPHLARRFTGRLAWPIFDMIALADLTGRTATTREARPALRSDLSFEFAAHPGDFQRVTDVDDVSLWADFQSLLASHAGASPP